MDKQTVINALKEVIDPEIGVNIVDLGLIYDVSVEGNDVRIKMTLTTPMCPLGPMIVDNVRKRVEKIDGIGDVDVQVVFEPAWSADRIDPKVREKLGFEV